MMMTLLLLAPALHAKPSKKPPATVAAEHMAAANQAFGVGHYEQALDELRQAYRLAPRPEFLLTFAQIYRAAGRLKPALEACNSYLAMAPNGPLAADAQKLAEMLRTEIERETPPPAPVSEPPPPVAPPRVEPPPIAQPVLVVPNDANEAAARAQRRRRRTAVGVALGVCGVVVVGLAVGLGVGLTVGAERKSTFGPIDFTPRP